MSQSTAIRRLLCERSFKDVISEAAIRSLKDIEDTLSEFLSYYTDIQRKLEVLGVNKERVKCEIENSISRQQRPIFSSLALHFEEGTYVSFDKESRINQVTYHLDCYNILRKSRLYSCYYISEILQNSRMGTLSLTKSFDYIVFEMSKLEENQLKKYVSELERQNLEVVGNDKLKLLGLREETIVRTTKQLVAQSLQPNFTILSKSLKNGRYYI